MEKQLKLSEYLVIGFLLFALFLGAGNIIFPPLLGQFAGDQLPMAIFGFLLTGVGLPLLGILAIAKDGHDLQSIASRVSPLFGIVFTIIAYLAIGPFFGIPRTATVSYEIGILPFLPESSAASAVPLALYTIIFFALTVWLAMNPNKLVDRIGKILTPVLLVIISLLAVKSILTPIGEIGPAIQTYETGAFFESFIQGYLTMDAIAALVFGIVVIQAIRERGVNSRGQILKATSIAGLIAAGGLALVYSSLSFIGATSTGAIGLQENGGTIISLASRLLYGESGGMIVAAAITVACVTTSIGLVSATAQFSHKLYPRLPYQTFVWIFSGFSAFVANIGLTQLIAVSLPVLLVIYPLAIVLVILSLIDVTFYRHSLVYKIALSLTGIVSIFDGLRSAGIEFDALDRLFAHLPLFDQGIGWALPALVGAVVGFAIVHLFGLKQQKV
ncbi:branched-chain amino acid transport system II carrier protein [Planomicrobium sp. YIM 101495]|uniref:branched-chain amino acid transport system II carrier protein n=1 Tax=Planomicrobium sp. YIM 101495 TaxID=2665160 RepID=UPI0012B8E4EC|nr:branched-chain amino acid transport system II carrier protein [Planomicrobium sp. YIM 101495]MTD30508.1 branched-chain amino acid transport system II carrier protein [Planomicrobium sp. YIM 101495]